MRIQTVTYRELRSSGNFSHQAIEATAQVEEGESADIALASVKQWVECEHRRLGETSEQQAELWNTEARLRRAQGELSELNHRVEQAKALWQRAQAFLERHGVAVDEPDIPF